MAKKKTTIKLKPYPLIERAVEEGIAYGWNRAHKHTDKPDPDHIKEQLLYYIMNELTEITNLE
jgi:hypothetical protein